MFKWIFELFFGVLKDPVGDRIDHPKNLRDSVINRMRPF